VPKLDDYQQFDGLHWETGSVRNYYDYRGIKAPHTNMPYSEAMLLGISGGVVMGYFSFAYEGYEPHVRILTRNTFNPLDTLLQRLGVVQNIRQTGIPEKGLANLVDTLEDGLPAIVWADMFSLPYNALSYDEGMWAMFPVVVYGYDEGADTAWISDRSTVPLTVTTSELAAARARVKKDKYRLLTLEPPDPEKLASATISGIWDTIKLYTEAPPKGSRNNFGFAAYDRWADLLTRPKQRLSWEKEFPAGDKMLAGLTSAFTDINIFGKNGYAERDVYAAFLDEASVLLDKPALKDVALQFRASGRAWDALAQALLPAAVPPLGETGELMLKRHRLFLEQGSAALPQIQNIGVRLEEIKSEIAADFPLNASEVTDMRQNLRDHVLKIRDIEQTAIAALRTAMS
jgi:hypothetical protein